MTMKLSIKSAILIVGLVGVIIASIVIFLPSLNLSTQNSNAQVISSAKTETTDITLNNNFKETVINEKNDLTIQTAGTKNKSAPKAGLGLPLRLKIPKINVDATIESVGLTPQGAMGVPKLSYNVAWFDYGPRPGEIGSAVMAGHVNWWNGAKSVFANLNKLKPGDKIMVIDDLNKTFYFIVRESRIYSLKDDSSEVFISTDGQAHLNLITCSGSWNKGLQQYSQRLIIFADQEILSNDL